MTLTQAIYELLSGTTAISDVVGDRIYPIQAPQNTVRPYVVFVILAGVGEYDHTHAKSVVRRVRVQFECWADSTATVLTLKEIVRDTLDNYKGTNGNVVIGSTEIVGEDEGFEANTRVPWSSIDAEFLIT